MILFNIIILLNNSIFVAMMENCFKLINKIVSVIKKNLFLHLISFIQRSSLFTKFF